MIEVYCARCHGELREKGAVLIAPPEQPETDRYVSLHKKYHICVPCFEETMKEWE